MFCAVPDKPWLTENGYLLFTFFALVKKINNWLNEKFYLTIVELQK